MTAAVGSPVFRGLPYGSFGVPERNEPASVCKRFRADASLS
nr:MAG TPA: hypothetical protein [Caudoviricetes sp.]